MKASRIWGTALTVLMGLGLCTVTTSAWAQSDSTTTTTTTTTSPRNDDSAKVPAQSDSSALNAQDKDADATARANSMTQPRNAAYDDQDASARSAAAPAADNSMAQQQQPVPAAKPAPRAYYDSSTDRTYYTDSNGAPLNDPNAGVRSGASSAGDQGSTEYVAPKKEASPRVHDMNRPTRVDSPSNTNAPAVGRETDARPQGPLNGLLVDAGLGAGFGMHAPGAVWGLGSEYSFAFDGMPDRLAFKGLFDVNFGYGSDLTQFLSIGVGANWYMGDFVGTEKNRAHIGVDVSAGDATNAVTGHSATSAVLGAGMNYTFLHTQQADFDAIIHYAILLEKLDNSMPSLLTFRVGMSF